MSKVDSWECPKCGTTRPITVTKCCENSAVVRQPAPKWPPGEWHSPIIQTPAGPMAYDFDGDPQLL